MALEMKDKPLTLARLRAGLIYRLGAVPRGEIAATYIEPALAARRDEIEMLRLQLDVNRTDGRDREARLSELERKADRQDALMDEYLGAVQTMCSYLAETCSRLRASS